MELINILHSVLHCDADAFFYIFCSSHAFADDASARGVFCWLIFSSLNFMIFVVLNVDEEKTVENYLLDGSIIAPGDGKI